MLIPGWPSILKGGGGDMRSIRKMGALDYLYKAE